MLNRQFLPVVVMASAAVGFTDTHQARADLPSLKVDEGGRYLVQELEGGEIKPFFWMGDTAWNLHKLQKADIDLYLEDRAAKGFNVIQGPVLDWSGLIQGTLKQQNGYGHSAYINKSLATPTLNADVPGAGFNDYFDQLDYIVAKADSLDMYIAPLPFWAQGINQQDDNNTEKAGLREIGRLLGDRYKDNKNVIWLGGGEAAGESPDASVRILNEGLAQGHGGNNLQTVHATGNASSGPEFHNEDWLDFNMIQSGHTRDLDNYNLVAADYERTPVKPTLDGEIFYTDFRRTSQPDSTRSTSLDARKGAYWSVFAGGFGVTYGHDAIWQFHDGPGQAKYNSTTPSMGWRAALDDEAAVQMIHLKDLIESHDILTRIPDQSIILAGQGGITNGSGDHLQATRDGTVGSDDATYLMVYSPVSDHTFTVDTSVIDASVLDASWFDPRDGTYNPFRSGFANTGSLEVTTPATGPDWVLVVSQQVPEPASAAVLGLGTAVLLGRSRGRS